MVRQCHCLQDRVETMETFESALMEVRRCSCPQLWKTEPKPNSVIAKEPKGMSMYGKSICFDVGVWSYFCLYWISNYLFKGFSLCIGDTRVLYTMHGCLAVTPDNESYSNKSNANLVSGQPVSTTKLLASSLSLTCIWLGLQFGYDLIWLVRRDWNLCQHHWDSRRLVRIRSYLISSIP
jgi:hypothetical protein